MAEPITDQDAIDAFHRISGTWLMEFGVGWYAYCNYERKIGPFTTSAEAARAGLKKWGSVG